MTAATTLVLAETTLRSRDSAIRGRWPRAVALLARQALEEGVREYWAQRVPGMADVRMRAQLLCLADYVADPTIAGRAMHAWAALSEACHHRAYDLPPTAGELEVLVADVGEVVEALKAP